MQLLRTTPKLQLEIAHIFVSAAGKPSCLRRAATHEVSYGLEGEGRMVY